MQPRSKAWDSRPRAISRSSRSSLSIGTYSGRQRILILGGLLFLCWLLYDDPIPTKGEFGLTATRTCGAGDVPPSRPIIQYALILDAGSTGSRIHIYRFNFCGSSSPRLEDEVFRHVKPGLSFYNDPELAASSLDGLLEEALRVIPERFWRCSPVAVKATAGLRLLGAEKADAVIAAVRARLESKYPFLVVKKDGVVVMDGKEEGVYAWITVNYLLDVLGKGKRLPTAAIMDLGGGSTQIVFEPHSTPLQPGDHKYELKFGGIEYTLYQHSHLGYGLMEGRKKIKELEITEEMTKTEILEEIHHPCFPTGYTETYLSTRIIGTQQGFLACYDKIIHTDKIFSKAGCLVEPCSFNGVYQPFMNNAFPAPREVYAFSYFYDLIRAFQFDEEFVFSVTQLRDLSKKVCGLGSDFPEIKHNPHYCADLVFCYALLKNGYDLDDVRTMKMAKKIGGIETGWALGAGIVMVEDMFEGGQGLTCVSSLDF